jgi:hypothetical protein
MEEEAAWKAKQRKVRHLVPPMLWLVHAQWRSGAEHARRALYCSRTRGTTGGLAGQRELYVWDLRALEFTAPVSLWMGRWRLSPRHHGDQSAVVQQLPPSPLPPARACAKCRAGSSPSW